MHTMDDADWAEVGKAFWEFSLAGVALVNEDFTFRLVNKQWIEIFGKTPDEFLGKTFGEITVVQDREKDIRNAKLVRIGASTNYYMNKTYQFSDGTERKVILLVARIPQDTSKTFRFFLSQVLPNEESIDEEIKKKISALEESIAKQSQSKSSPPPEQAPPYETNNNFWAKFTEFLVKYWVAIAVGSAIAAGSAAGVIDELYQMGWFGR